MAQGNLPQPTHFGDVIRVYDGNTLTKDGILKISNNPTDGNAAYAVFTAGTSGTLRVNARNGFEEYNCFPVKRGDTITSTGVSSNSRITMWLFPFEG